MSSSRGWAATWNKEDGDCVAFLLFVQWRTGVPLKIYSDQRVLASNAASIWDKSTAARLKQKLPQVFFEWKVRERMGIPTEGGADHGRES